MQVSDHEIKQALAARGIECKSYNADMLYEPWEVLDPENQPCTTFEDFWSWCALPWGSHLGGTARVMARSSAQGHQSGWRNSSANTATRLALTLLRSVSSKQYPPPVPVPAPTYLPPVYPAIASETPSSIDWFMTKEQEAASDQLRFKWKPGVAGAVAKLEAFFRGKLPVSFHPGFDGLGFGD